MDSRSVAFVAVLGASLFSMGAQAADICTAVALRDVPALENRSSILKKGQLDTAITQYRVNKRTGETSFCSHGGYCYPSRIQIGGDLLAALRLTNCQVADDHPPFDEGEYLDYEVEPIRIKVPPALLRYDDLDNKLLAMGLCSACADNVAQYYPKQPNSQCAKLARSALEGNPEATGRFRISHHTANGITNRGQNALERTERTLKGSAPI